MRTLVLIALLACRGQHTNDLPPEAWGTADYVAAGVPASDHPWTIDEHEAAAIALAKAVAGHRDRLPHLGGVRSGAVFARIVEPTPTTDVLLDIKTDFILHARRTEAANSISKLYLVDPMAAASPDYLAVLELMLQEIIELDRTADGFLATFAPDDPTREVRVGGLAKMHQGWVGMLIGSAIICRDVRVAEAARVHLAKRLATTLPRVFGRFEPKSQWMIRTQVAAVRISASDAVRDALPLLP